MRGLQAKNHETLFDRTSNNALAKESEALVREHVRLAGFPITKVPEVPTVIGPMSAFE